MLDVKMTDARDDDGAASGDFGFSGKKREVTSQSHHACFNYVTAILYVTTVVTCLVFIRDLRHRQTLMEQKLGFVGDGERACCTSGHVMEPQVPPDQDHVGNMETEQQYLISKFFNNVNLSKNAPGRALPGQRASPPAKPVPIPRSGRESSYRMGGMDFGSGEGDRSPRRQGRSRRDVEYSTIQNRTTKETEADEDITRSFGLTSVTPSHLHRPRSNTVAEVPTEVGALRPNTQKHPINGKKVAKRSRSGTTRHSRKNDRCCERHLTAIHLEAPEDFDRKYESGPGVSMNASDTRDAVYRFWQKASWVEDSASEVFHLDDVTGHVTVEVDGIYLIYAQVVYHDLSGRWSFGIYVGDRERVKCLATEQLRDLHSYHRSSHGVYHSCYTSLVLHVRKNQSVSVRCLYGSRTILTQPQFTFWGIVRL